jgi:ribosomal protein S27E
VEGIPRGFEQTFGRDLTKQVALNLGTVWGERWRMVSEAWRWQERPLPDYVQREFEDYLRCGRLEHGFLRVRCDTCHVEHLVAFSCKRRGFCPSCGARRMAESAALLVDEVFPEQPVRQWVLSFPYPLRFLFASRPAIMGQVLGIVYRVIASHLIQKGGFTRRTARTGAVTLMMCREARMPRSAWMRESGPALRQCA